MANPSGLASKRTAHVRGPSIIFLGWVGNSYTNIPRHPARYFYSEKREKRKKKDGKT
jgi:hypothetical protein